MTAPSPTVTPERIKAPRPIHTSLPICTSPFVHGMPSSSAPGRLQRSLKGKLDIVWILLFPPVKISTSSAMEVKDPTITRGVSPW